VSNKTLVKNFIDAWNNMDLESVTDFFSEDVFYHNIPMEPLNGKEEASAFVKGLSDCESINWELIAIAEEGNMVLTERIDNFNFKDGRKISLPVMGTFEIEDNKIKQWRDYFDLETFQKQISGKS
ncbi:uncharacterized protein METZ01_LOCUS111049, partial [marine metagenome]